MEKGLPDSRHGRGGVGGAASVVVVAVRVGVGGSHGDSSQGCGGAASVVVVAVCVGVGVTVVVAVSSLCFGLQRFGLEGQRLNDSTRLLHHLHLSGVRGGGCVVH